METQNVQVLTRAEGSQAVPSENKAAGILPLETTHYFYDMLSLHLLREEEWISHMPYHWAVPAHELGSSYHAELNVK